MTNSRQTCRAGHRCEPATLREALHCQFVHAAAPLEQLADLEGLHAHTLAAMVNPNRDDTWLPMRRISSLLERTADHDALACYLASRCHGVCVRPKQPVEAPATALMAAIAEQARELGEAAAAIDQALRSGNAITVDELPRLDKEIDDLVEAGLRLKATVHAVARPAAARLRSV